MIKLVVICRVFVSEYMIYRWRVMARENKDLDITLIGHIEFKSNEFGKGNKELALGSVEEDRFHYIPATFKRSRLYSDGIGGLRGWLRLHRPDFVYLIGLETDDISLQVAYVKRRYLPNMKVAMFSMRGPDMPTYLRYRIRWTILKRFYDAIFVHYPHGVDIMREQGGYEGPVYMQTQLGVNNEWFHPNIEARREIRAQYGINDDDYVFGVVCRTDIRKGLIDILDAVPDNPKVKLMHIGDGPDMPRFKEHITKLGLEKRVILTGYVPLPEPSPHHGVKYIQDYFNALDCNVLMSQTFPKSHVDSYPLVVSQGMATALPCIVSSSGGLPYEVGAIGDVVPERDVAALHKAMLHRFENQEEGREQGRLLFDRLQHTFEMHHLNRCFVTVMKDILEGRFNLDHADQTQFVF